MVLLNSSSTSSSLIFSPKLVRMYLIWPLPTKPERSLSNTWNPRMYSSMSKGSRKPPGRFRILLNVSKSTAEEKEACQRAAVQTCRTRSLGSGTYSRHLRRAPDLRSRRAWGFGRRRGADRRGRLGRHGRCRACRKAGRLRGSLWRPAGCYPWCPRKRRFWLWRRVWRRTGRVSGQRVVVVGGQQSAAAL